MAEPRTAGRRVRLGEVAINSTAATKDPEGEGFTRYVIGKHIPADGGRITAWNPIGDAEFGSRIRTIFRAGDIICTTRGPHLKVAVPEFDGLSAHTNFILRPKNPGALLPGYLEAVVRSQGFQDHLRKHFRGSTNLFVNWSDAAQHEFPLPPPNVQAEIAGLLERSDEVLRSHRDAVRLSEELYQSALCHVFIKRHCDPGISPEVWAQDGWPCLRLQDVADPDAPISYGIVQVGDSTPGGVPTATSNNLNIGFTTRIHFTAASIEAPYARSRIRGGDILVTVKGFGTGNIGRVPDFFAGNINRDVARLRFRTGPDADYFTHLWKCSAFERYWRAVSVGTTRPELSIGKLRDMVVPWPTAEVRAEVAGWLAAVSSAVVAASSRHLQALALHQRLNERVLTSPDTEGVP